MFILVSTISLRRYRVRSIGLDLIKSILLLASACAATGGLKQTKMFCQLDARVMNDEADVNFTVEDIPAHLCTDILVGFFHLDPEVTSVFSPADKGGITQLEKELFTLRKSHPGLRLHLTVGMPDTPVPNGNLLEVVLRTDTMTRFAELLTSHVDSGHYDGLNVYWTSAGIKDLKLIKFLRHVTKLISSGVKRSCTISVTIAAFPLKGGIYKNFPTLLPRLVDYVIVKAFDLSVDLKPIESHTHPLHVRREDEMNPDLRYLDQARSVQWWEAHGVPSDKIVVGFPAHGRYLQTSSQSLPGTGPHNSTYISFILSVSQVCYWKTEDPGEWTESWDKRWMAPYMLMHTGHHRHWLFHQNNFSITNRVRWLLSRDYAGLMFWTLNTDDFSAHCHKRKFPILTAGFAALKSFDQPGGFDLPLQPLHMSEKRAESSKILIFIGFGLLWFVCLTLVFAYWFMGTGHSRLVDDNRQ